MPPTKLSVSASQVLTGALAASVVAKEIGDAFPPAAAAAGVLLLILHTIKHLQSNQIECYRLAQRCLDLLTHIKEQTEGKSDIPPSLTKSLERFERILQDIHDKMQKFTGRSWKSRLVKKGDIERTIEDLNAHLDDAARSFQISTLINIHYAIGDRTPSTSPSSEGSSSYITDFSSRQNTDSSGVPVRRDTLAGTFDESHLLSKTERSTLSTHSGASDIGNSFEVVSDAHSRPPTPNEYGFQRTQSPVESIDSDPPASSNGFSSSDDGSVSDTNEDPFIDTASDTRAPSMNNALAREDCMGNEAANVAPFWREYHQSDIILQGRSKIKDGWWAGTMEVGLDGRTVVVKRYEGDRGVSKKLWQRDLFILKTIQHRNLPTLVGLSTEDSTTPFILLAETRTKALRLFLRDAANVNDTSAMLKLLLKLYHETLEIAQHVQERLNLSDSTVQDYIEGATYRVTVDEHVLLGLPPSEVHDIISHRQWTLKESVRDVLMAALHSGLRDSFLVLLQGS